MRLRGSDEADPEVRSWPGVGAVRADFPFYHTASSAREPRVYLDSGATTLVPRSVLDRYVEFYATCGGSPGRGGHSLAHEAARLRAGGRQRLKRFFGAGDEAELIFVRNATEGLNLAAAGLTSCVRAGDRIIVTALEHHSNYLPWFRLADRTGSIVDTIPLKGDGRLDLEYLERLAGERVAVIAVTHTSNVTGYRPDLNAVRAFAEREAARVVLDAVQAPAHEPLSFDDLGVDLMAVSAHKMFGPKGIGALLGRTDTLRAFEPFLLGGGTVHSVEPESVVYLDPPARFEAGTQDVAAIVAWVAACDWLSGFDPGSISAHEEALAAVLRDGLACLPGVAVIGNGERASPAITSFASDWIHSHDLAAALDERGICIRTGHMCAQPLLRYVSYHSLNRVSLALYNSRDDVMALLGALGSIVGARA